MELDSILIRNAVLTVDDFVTTKRDRSKKRLVTKRLPAHDDHLVRVAGEHAASVLCAVRSEGRLRNARREIERTAEILDLRQGFAPTRTHRAERLVTARDLRRHELILHDALRADDIALEPELTRACKRARCGRAVAIDDRAGPHRVLVHLDRSELVAEHHATKTTIADRQRLRPFFSGLRVPHQKIAGVGDGREQRHDEKCQDGEQEDSESHNEADGRSCAPKPVISPTQRHAAVLRPVRSQRPTSLPCRHWSR